MIARLFPGLPVIRYGVAILVFAGVAAIASGSWLEAMASLFGLLSVWLAARENIWYYPTGIISVALFAWIFYEVKLYADVTLQAVFLILSVYGWVIWLTKRGSRKVRPTTSLGRGGWLTLILVTPVISYTWGYALHAYTDAAIPYLDATIATMSMAAQFLLSRKVLENWYLWIVVDVLSIGVYWYKGLTEGSTGRHIR